MRFKMVTLFAAGIALGASTVPSRAYAQEKESKHHHYKLVEVGTFGGPSSGSFFGDAQSLNSRGLLVGQADTPTADPNFPNLNPYLNSDPFIHHAFRTDGRKNIDLGTLPGLNNSETGWVNNQGIAVGSSTDGSIDPLTGWPAEIAVKWSHDQILSLGTLGGNESQATAVNSRGQIAGFAANTIPDSFFSPIAPGLPGFGTQQHPFLWENGVMHDLGTLGGPDAVALLINERGQIAGNSYTSATPNATGFPTVHPFVWEDGKMLDIGSFGGTFCITGCVNWLNNRGQAVGGSDLPEDTTEHPFLWSEDEGMKDLGTLGGTFGAALWVNEDGKVVGAATTEGDLASLAFLWVEGRMTNLGALAGDACSIGININSHDQVVGSSVAAANCGSDSGRAFLWEGGDLVDLNIFVPAGKGLTLTQGAFINDRGEILATGVLADGDIRSVLLIPCDENHPGIEDCDYSLVDPAAVAQRLAQTNNKVPEVFRLSARRFAGRRP